MFTAITTVRVHPDKYEKDFHKVVTFLIQYIDKRVPTPGVKVASVSTRHAKWQKTTTNHGTFKGKIELKKYSGEEYNSMLMAQCQQLYELWKGVELITGKKTTKSSRAFKARVAMLKAKTHNSSNERLFADEKPKANNRNNPALDRKGTSIRQSCADT